MLDADLETSEAWRVPGLSVGMREWNGEPMRTLLKRLVPGAHARH